MDKMKSALKRYRSYLKLLAQQIMRLPLRQEKDKITGVEMTLSPMMKFLEWRLMFLMVKQDKLAHKRIRLEDKTGKLSDQMIKALEKTNPGAMETIKKAKKEAEAKARAEQKQESETSLAKTKNSKKSSKRSKTATKRKK